MLNNNTFYCFRFVFSSEGLKADATNHPDVKLRYFYKTNDLQSVTVHDATIDITYCKNNIISGRFTPDGEYANSTGSAHR